MSALPQPAQIDADARRVFDVVRDGGVALIHLDVAYALVARSAQGVRRVYAAKGRDERKPMGIVGSGEAHAALQLLSEPRRAMVRAITVEHDLPLSVVAPYRADHPYVLSLDPFVIQHCTQAATMNLLLNAGALRTSLARLCWSQGVAMVGTSANLSLSGSRYSVDTLEAEIRAAADVIIDYGISRYANREGHSSTIIDFAGLRLLRRGVCADQILAVLRRQFGVNLSQGQAAGSV